MRDGELERVSVWGVGCGGGEDGDGDGEEGDFVVEEGGGGCFVVVDVD